MGRFDVSVNYGPQDIADVTRAFQQGFQSEVSRQEREKDRKLTYKMHREKLGVSSTKNAFTEHMKTIKFQQNDFDMGEEVSGLSWSKYRSRGQIMKRDELVSEQFTRVQATDFRNANVNYTGKKLPSGILRNVTNTAGGLLPTFSQVTEAGAEMLEDMEGVTLGENNEVLVEDEAVLVKVLALLGNPIHVPRGGSKKYWKPLPGEVTTGDTTAFEDTGELKRRYAISQKKIDGINTERYRARAFEALRQKVPVEELSLQGRIGKQHPRLKDFLQMSEETNFNGMSNSQKNSLKKEIERFGGIEGAIQELMKYAGPTQDLRMHQKWLTNFAMRNGIVGEEDNPFDFSGIDTSYFTSPEEALAEEQFLKVFLTRTKNRGFGAVAPGTSERRSERETALAEMKEERERKHRKKTTKDTSDKYWDRRRRKWVDRGTPGTGPRSAEKARERKARDDARRARRRTSSTARVEERKQRAEQARLERIEYNKMLDKRIRRNFGQPIRSYTSGEWAREQDLKLFNKMPNQSWGFGEGSVANTLLQDYLEGRRPTNTELIKGKK